MWSCMQFVQGTNDNNLEKPRLPVDKSSLVLILSTALLA